MYKKKTKHAKQLDSHLIFFSNIVSYCYGISLCCTLLMISPNWRFEVDYYRWLTCGRKLQWKTPRLNVLLKCSFALFSLPDTIVTLKAYLTYYLVVKSRYEWHSSKKVQMSHFPTANITTISTCLEGKGKAGKAINIKAFMTTKIQIITELLIHRLNMAYVCMF